MKTPVIFIAVENAEEYADLAGILRMEGFRIDRQAPGAILLEGDELLAKIDESDLVIEVVGSDRAARIRARALEKKKPVIQFVPRKNRMIVTEARDLVSVIDAMIDALSKE